jgi:molecular chaperone GrpE
VSGSDRRSDQSREEPHVVIRDRRRIDPTTGDVRDRGAANSPFPGSTSPADPAQAAQPINAQITADSEEFAKLAAELAERTSDLQRITAEYANYRKRVDRDREVLITNAKASVAGELLSVLDDLELANAHGDLTGAFKKVADRLIGVLERLGLQGFGAEGDPFDPAHHEAVQFGTSVDVDAPTVTAVFRRGYSFKDRPLRAAVVSVTGPEHSASTGETVSVSDTPAAEAADLQDMADDAKARSEQESKHGIVPDLGDEPPSTNGQPEPTEDPA